MQKNKAKETAVVAVVASSNENGVGALFGFLSLACLSVAVLSLGF